jgi:hypothetical protein
MLSRIMADAQRRCQLIAPDNAVAALQILAFLAYPTRPDYAIDILREWARHRINLRDGSRVWPTSQKWSRLEPKLWRLDDMVKRRLRGSYWLRLQVNQRLGGTFHAAGQRACARRIGAAPGDEKNIIRDYWTQSRSVAHLGLSTGDAIMLALSPEERIQRRWNLARAAFKPDWVDRAVADAERNAALADQYAVIPIGDAIQFVR